ncbi:MAG: hypothetical protein K6F31_09435, partial [Acetatifactor sp.]|nr:hypothetical protein [Acetatifactor sp.]
SHCANCGEVLVKQETIPKTGHTPVAVPDQTADCTHDGYTGVTKCSTCGAMLSGSVVPALGHLIQYDDAIEATCTCNGWTAGQWCMRCATWLVESEYIEKLGHEMVIDTNSEYNYPPTCGTVGYVTTICNRPNCGYTERTMIDKTNEHEWNEETGRCNKCGQKKPAN